MAIFVEQLVDGPPAAAVERIERARLTPIHHRGFVISGSSTALDVSIRIAPDVATCDGCLTELFDPTNRRHRHPFITCPTCGPRYAVITGLPYDRSRGDCKPAQVAVVVEADCIGCTKCIQACPVDAIVGAAKLMHVVIDPLCTGCELCVPACPVDCIVMEPAPPL